MEKVLTIIIPSYNTSRYIDKGVGTMIDERLYSDVEILMINDGSTDNTKDIIKEYETKFPQYIKLIDKENGGHGSAINTGLLNASGKYVKVVDGDDWVDTEGLVNLVSYLKETDVDVVYNSYMSHGEKSGKESPICKMDVESGKVYSIQELIEKGLNPKIHTITIKKIIFISNGISLTEKCFYEDFQYSNYPIPFVRTALYLDFPVYFYLTEQKTQSVSYESTYKNIHMFVKVYQDADKFFSNIQFKDNVISEYIETQLMIFLRQTYNVFLRNSKQQDVIKKFKYVDSELKDINIDRYKRISDKFHYIKLMRFENKLIFNILSILFKIYKKV